MSTVLIALAVIPSFALLMYVYNKDGTKEPPSLLIKLFFIGAATCLPAALLETGFEHVLNLFFNAPKEGELSFYVYLFFLYFFGVAFIEEGLKWVAMLIITKNNKEFNSLFDGFVYAIFVSLGFATLENILYVADGGMRVALLRAVTSIPGHMFYAVFMGYYYSEYHKKELASRMEAYYSYVGLLRFKGEKISYTTSAILSLLIPILIHGFYDFCLSANVDFLLLVYIAFMIMLYTVCFKQINKAAKFDAPDTTAAISLIYVKYPEFLEYARQRQFKATQSYYQTVQPRPIYQNLRPAHHNQVQQTTYQPVQQTAYQSVYQQNQQPQYAQQNYNRQHQNPNYGYVQNSQPIQPQYSNLQRCNNAYNGYVDYTSVQQPTANVSNQQYSQNNMQ